MSWTPQNSFCRNCGSFSIPDLEPAFEELFNADVPYGNIRRVAGASRPFKAVDRTQFRLFRGSR